MTITLTLPDDTYPLYARATDVAAEVQLHHAQILYAEGRISIGKATELAGVDMVEFMRLCAQVHIPAVDYESSDLAAEMLVLASSHP